MPFGEILANMRGTVEIYFQTGKMLYFRRRSVWRNEFILTDGTRQVIAQLQGKFHWAKLGFDYEIDVYDNRLDREINTLIPFLMTYSAMYLKRRTAAAG
ncbi:MAG: hypothetical protein EOP51_14615 [Sphingobacteriales bacterium]|nr:MAG: hypothetical protein EOP51_14615 [Sphingobacteriales bacterium]